MHPNDEFATRVLLDFATRNRTVMGYDYDVYLDIDAEAEDMTNGESVST